MDRSPQKAGSRHRVRMLALGQGISNGNRLPKKPFPNLFGNGFLFCQFIYAATFIAASSSGRDGIEAISMSP
jgi:hypothetical protein